MLMSCCHLARLRNLTYASRMYVNVRVSDAGGEVEGEDASVGRVVEKVFVGKVISPCSHRLGCSMANSGPHHVALRILCSLRALGAGSDAARRVPLRPGLRSCCAKEAVLSMLRVGRIFYHQRIREGFSCARENVAEPHLRV